MNFLRNIYPDGEKVYRAWNKDNWTMYLKKMRSLLRIALIKASQKKSEASDEDERNFSVTDPEYQKTVL